MGFKLDELALVIYARMYHVGISIILRTDIWTTRTNGSLKDCDVVLCHHGNLQFSDTGPKMSEITTGTEKKHQKLIVNGKLLTL